MKVFSIFTGILATVVAIAPSQAACGTTQTGQAGCPALVPVSANTPSIQTPTQVSQTGQAGSGGMGPGSSRMGGQMSCPMMQSGAMGRTGQMSCPMMQSPAGGMGSGMQGGMSQPGLTPVGQGQTPIQGQAQMGVPTVPVTFQETLDPARVTPGETFQAVIQAPIIVNGEPYPQGTIMTGQVVGVQRPSAQMPGQLQLAFTGLITPDGQLVAFAQPSDVQAVAQFGQAGAAGAAPNENVLGRVVAFPFRWGGDIIRTGGNVLQEVGATTGDVLGDVGGSLGSFVSLQPGEGFRQAGSAVQQPFRGAGRIVGTTVTGDESLVAVSGNRINYLFTAEGQPMRKIQAGQTVPIAFLQGPSVQPVMPGPGAS